MMCIITPGKNENMPQASSINPSQCTFYLAWWLRQSSKWFFTGIQISSGEWGNWMWISRGLSEYIDHTVTVQRNNSGCLSSERWVCLLVFHKYKLTGRSSQDPDIGEMPKLFFFFLVCTYWTASSFEVKLKSCSSHQDLIHMPTYPMKNLYICQVIGKGKK